MCGISGIVNFSFGEQHNLEQLHRMVQLLHHRGPDNSDVFTDESSGVYLAHNRLSILDLSAAGHQPIFSNSGRYVMTYNGEVYNFPEMKSELLQHNIVFKGSSDSEVIVNYVEVFGIKKTAKKLNGIFAFAIFDRKEKKLFIVRDHLGIKPLYFAQYKSKFIFASELGAIAVDPDFSKELNKESLNNYLAFGYVTAPHSIYRNVQKLPAGHLLELDVNPSLQYKISRYWTLEESFLKSEKEPLDSYQDATLKLEKLLEQAVKDQMISDVSLGAFLSGGIDSSLVVALMQKNSSKPIKTFTIGFDDKAFNEAEHAKTVAKHIGTDHSELYVNEKDALDFIPKIASVFGEPFYDSSCIPTFMVSQLAKSQVTVSLSGDGGDEFFCGYKSFIRTSQYFDKIQKIPAPARKLAGASMLTLYNNTSFYNNRKVRLAKALLAKDYEDFYFNAKKTWVNESLLTNFQNTTLPHFNSFGKQLQNRFNKMMYFDASYYLPDDILAKVDRTSMAVSLEARVPLLDKRLVEYAISLPLSYKLEGLTGKRILREVLYKYVPKTLIDKPKTGFAIPLEKWLKGSLKDWGESIVDNAKKNAAIDGQFVRKEWDAFQKGKSINTQLIWTVLMFQDWCDKNKI